MLRGRQGLRAALLAWECAGSAGPSRGGLGAVAAAAGAARGWASPGGAAPGGRGSTEGVPARAFSAKSGGLSLGGLSAEEVKRLADVIEDEEELDMGGGMLDQIHLGGLQFYG